MCPLLMIYHKRVLLSIIRVAYALKREAALVFRLEIICISYINNRTFEQKGSKEFKRYTNQGKSRLVTYTKAAKLQAKK